MNNVRKHTARVMRKNELLHHKSGHLYDKFDLNREKICVNVEICSSLHAAAKICEKLEKSQKFANIGFLFTNTCQKIANFAAATNLNRSVKCRAELDLFTIPKTGPSCSIHHYPMDNYY